MGDSDNIALLQQRAQTRANILTTMDAEYGTALSILEGQNRASPRDWWLDDMCIRMIAHLRGQHITVENGINHSVVEFNRNRRGQDSMRLYTDGRIHWERLESHQVLEEAERLQEKERLRQQEEAAISQNAPSAKHSEAQKASVKKAVAQQIYNNMKDYQDDDKFFDAEEGNSNVNMIPADAIPAPLEEDEDVDLDEQDQLKQDQLKLRKQPVGQEAMAQRIAKREEAKQKKFTGLAEKATLLAYVIAAAGTWVMCSGMYPQQETDDTLEPMPKTIDPREWIGRAIILCSVFGILIGGPVLRHYTGQRSIGQATQAALCTSDGLIAIGRTLVMSIITCFLGVAGGTIGGQGIADGNITHIMYGILITLVPMINFLTFLNA